MRGMAKLPDHPPVPHSWFEHADHTVVVDAPALHPRALTVHYREAGPTEPGSDPRAMPLLLVHGLQTSGYSWRYVLDELARTRRVIVPDLVGSGRSDSPGSFGYDPLHMASMLDELRRALGVERWMVVGNSLGGIYAACHAAEHPASVDRVAIIHAPGFMDRGPLLGLELVRRGLMPAAGSRAFGPWLVHRYLRYHTRGMKSREEVEEFSRSWGTAEGRLAAFHVIRDALAPERAAELPQILGRVEQDALLVWARNDTLIPPATAERWLEHLPTARLDWIDESSHFTQVDQPAATVAALEPFLQA